MKVFTAQVRDANRGKRNPKNHNDIVVNNVEFWRGISWVRERFLGKGAFGLVYMLKRKQPMQEGDEDSELPSVMAVKTASMKRVSLLKYEKEILCMYTASPYIIRCYGAHETQAGDSRKMYSLFLEFCSGGSLYDRIRTSVNGLPGYEVRRYAKNIVQGLDYIHGNGIVHCDIKPDNILLVPDGEKNSGFIAKLADFGLAKNVDYEEEENSDRKGTFCYMSPELAKDRLLTYPADIWALGCVVVEMMSGKSAWGYGFSSKEELLYHIAFSSEVPKFPGGISEQGKDFLSKCFIRNFYLRWTDEQLLEHPFLAV